MKKITLEKLAIMIQRGFEDVLETTAKKTDLEAFKNEIKEEITFIKNRLNIIERKLDNIVYQAEFVELKFRIEKLEKQVQRISK